MNVQLRKGHIERRGRVRLACQLPQRQDVTTTLVLVRMLMLTQQVRAETTLMSPKRSQSTAAESPTSPPPSNPKTVWASMSGLVRRLSFSRIQSIVGTLAGIASLTGAAFSVVQFARPGNTGELVAIVVAAGSHQSVTDATVEVLTTENALVATLTPDAAGRVTQALKEGVYVVRVSHPRYAADVRRIQVQPRQTIEIKTTLHAGSSTPIERAVSKGASSLRRALGF